MAGEPEFTDFRGIAETAYGIEAWFEPGGRLRWVNRSIERVVGYTPAQCLEAPNLVELLVYEKDRGYVTELARRAAEGAVSGSAEVRLRRKDGSLVWVAMFWRSLHDSSGARGLRLSAIEIQSRKEAELQLLDTVAELRRTRALQDHFLNRSNEERARLEALLNVVQLGVLFMDNDHRVVFCNKPFKRIWGLPESETLTGMREAVLLDRTAALRSDDAGYRHHVEHALARKQLSEPYECTLADGRTIRDLCTPVAGAGRDRITGRIWIFEDITEQKRAQARLVELAERDPLTHLYNRRRFLEELDRMLADATRRGSQLGLLAFDLDGFKPINDRYGHQAGDEVLKAIAHEVGAVIRRNEIFFRVGGDEFAILAPDVGEENLTKLARRICAKIAHLPLAFEGKPAGITASVGIALYPLHAGSAAELTARGDQAMYDAKACGKNTWRVYDPACPASGAAAKA
ncbi:MAG: hypothetical protein Fur0039_16680 [Rhodocyclaceae bacterium]